MDASADLTVAGAAAATTVAVALAAEYVLGTDVGLLLTVAPLYVYFGYLFTRRASLPAPLDSARNWAVLSVLSGVVVLGYALV